MSQASSPPAATRERLLRHLGDDVLASAKTEGAAIVADVSLLRCSSGKVSSVLLGGRSCFVSLNLGGDMVDSTCDCRAFVDSLEICKHIWATVLVAIPRGFLANLSPEAAPVLIPLPKGGTRSVREQAREKRPVPPPPRPQWDRTLQDWLARAKTMRPPTVPPEAIRPLSVFFALDPAEAVNQDGLTFRIFFQEPLTNGKLGAVRPPSITRSAALRRLNSEESAALMALCGVGSHSSGYGDAYRYGRGIEDSVPSNSRVPSDMLADVLPRLCGSGRVFYMRDGGIELSPIAWDAGGPWDFLVSFVRVVDAPTRLMLSCAVRRDGVNLPREDLVFITKSGVLGARSWLGIMNIRGGFPLLTMSSDGEPVVFEAVDLPNVVAKLLRFSDLPPIQLPEGMTLVTDTVRPVPQMSVRKSVETWRKGFYDAQVTFDYGGRSFSRTDGDTGWWDDDAGAARRRDRAFEAEAPDVLPALGFKADRYSSALAMRISEKKLIPALRALIGQGWKVLAEGQAFRAAGDWKVGVSSGVDWFDLEGGIDFDGHIAPIPQLLAAVKKGENTILLGDGSIGMIPDDWMKKYGGLAGLGEANGASLRFASNQVGILDALLASQPEVEVDAAFRRARERLRTFDRIAPATEPKGFVGELRPYQRDGLAWLRFLEQFGFGGCLADDMGLGKTVQVLAYLLGRKRTGPALVVCPRSLIFNWKAEARRFTPQLRVLDHSGNDRLPPGAHFGEFDIVLTTYGLLRKDAPALAKVHFDLVILDEAQAIKNRDTESAKAARVLRAPHRLALSGTPIENRLSELWSILEFLNPGILGAASSFDALASRDADPASLAALARGVRPFLLRRTKEQVVKDLPRKLEQTLYCELEGPQRKLYDELREHYRASLLGKVAATGIARAKIHVLEALLRLRQAACHPGLIDKTKAGELSPKIETLLGQVQQVTEEGHKALVFSQFTSLLGILRKHLDSRGLTYEYLDGKTRDREARVKQFRESPDCRLFLISLKAGGLGLNLVEADYVFLLDPWWNPAVEAQAIDRTHRIGQTRPVFAYRLIARDTVEEKVLQLQEKKRSLADAIIRADESLIRSLTREDLELLLS